MVVICPPTFDGLSRVIRCEKPVFPEAFIAESAIEQLDERVVGLLACTEEVDLHTILVDPQIHVQRQSVFSHVLSPGS